MALADPFLIAMAKTFSTRFGNHQRLESCVAFHVFVLFVKYAAAQAQF